MIKIVDDIHTLNAYPLIQRYIRLLVNNLNNMNYMYQIKILGYIIEYCYNEMTMTLATMKKSIIKITIGKILKIFKVTFYKIHNITHKAFIKWKYDCLGK